MYKGKGKDRISEKNLPRSRNSRAQNTEDRCRQSRLSELNSDVMDEERGGVCQTPVTTKKKEDAVWQTTQLPRIYGGIVSRVKEENERGAKVLLPENLMKFLFNTTALYFHPRRFSPSHFQ